MVEFKFIAVKKFIRLTILKKQLLLCAVIVFTFLTADCQRQYPAYKVSVGGFMFADYSYWNPGIAAEFSVSRKLYKSFYARLWYHKSNSHHFAIPKDEWQGYTPELGAPDVYGNYFIGKPVAGFFGDEYDSYNKNAFLFNLAINREFGRKQFKYIPEFGLSFGWSQEFEFFLKSVGSQNGIITGASSQARFIKGRVFGVNMSPLNIEYGLKNGFALQFAARLYLTTTREKKQEGANAYYSVGDPYDGVAFGFTLVKSFNQLKFSAK